MNQGADNVIIRFPEAEPPFPGCLLRLFWAPRRDPEMIYRIVKVFLLQIENLSVLPAI
jgi:hypothetical protein